MYYCRCISSCYFLASTYFHDILMLSLSVAYASTETLKESWYGMSPKFHFGPWQMGTRNLYRLWALSLWLSLLLILTNTLNTQKCNFVTSKSVDLNWEWFHLLRARGNMCRYFDFHKWRKANWTQYKEARDRPKYPIAQRTTTVTESQHQTSIVLMSRNYTLNISL